MNLKPIAITNDVTTCECCGRANLKSTVVMIDDEGNTSYYGSDCAEKVTGKHAAKIVSAARANMNKQAEFAAYIQSQIDSINAIERGLINLTLRERLHEQGWNSLGLNQPMKPEARREIYVAWMRARVCP